MRHIPTLLVIVLALPAYSAVCHAQCQSPGANLRFHKSHSAHPLEARCCGMRDTTVLPNGFSAWLSAMSANAPFERGTDLTPWLQVHATDDPNDHDLAGGDFGLLSSLEPMLNGEDFPMNSRPQGDTRPLVLSDVDSSL